MKRKIVVKTIEFRLPGLNYRNQELIAEEMKKYLNKCASATTFKVSTTMCKGSNGTTDVKVELSKPLSLNTVINFSNGFSNIEFSKITYYKSNKAVFEV